MASPTPLSYVELTFIKEKEHRMTNRMERLSRGRVTRLVSLAAFALLSLCLPDATPAQWVTNGSNISSANTGNVGVGNPSPYAKLTVGDPAKSDGRLAVEGQDNATSILFNTGGANRGRITTLQNGLHLQSYSGAFLRNDLFIRNDGNVGVGNVSPYFKLTVGDPARYDGRLAIESNDNATSILFNTGGTNRGRITTLENGLHFQAYSGAFQRSDLFVRNDGSVGVGTTAPAAKLHVAGDIRVDGNINAKYQDVAEWVPTTQKLSAGTVVVLDPGRPNHVLASKGSYDTAVAGVVSEKPGLTLGEAGDGKALVATTGRVKVRVDATRAPIKIGDLIVTSDLEGVAMKSEPVMVGGRRIHAPGTIIGKALEPLSGGTGEILVLLSLQ